jgi:PadR family transcriptional regulator, regulatory protein PadR
MPPSTDLLQGTLDLLVLRTLALEPMHGWGIAQRIQQVSGDALQIGQGSLYPALHRLEYKGWVLAEWRPSEKQPQSQVLLVDPNRSKAARSRTERLGTHLDCDRSGTQVRGL